MRRVSRILILFLLVVFSTAPAIPLFAAPAQDNAITPVPGEWASETVSYETKWGETYNLTLTFTVSEDGTELTEITLFLHGLYGLISTGTLGTSTPIEGGTFTIDFDHIVNSLVVARTNVTGVFVDEQTLEATVTHSPTTDVLLLTAHPLDSPVVEATESVEQAVMPKPGLWEGDFDARFEVGEDGLVRNFTMNTPFEVNGREVGCTLARDDNPEFAVEADGSVTFSDVTVKDSEIEDDFIKVAMSLGIDIPTETDEAGDTLVILERVKGQFTGSEAFSGSFSLLICGGTFSAPASQGEWTAHWVSGEEVAEPTEESEGSDASPADTGEWASLKPGRWTGNDSATGSRGSVSFTLTDDLKIEDLEARLPGFGMQPGRLCTAQGVESLAVERLHGYELEPSAGTSVLFQARVESPTRIIVETLGVCDGAMLLFGLTFPVEWTGN